MLSVPAKLILSPLNAFADEKAGEAFRENASALPGEVNLKLRDGESSLTHFIIGDLLVCAFTMYEFIKGPDSFYFPYLQALPEPDTIAKWDSSDVDELQVHNTEYMFTIVVLKLCCSG